MKIGRLLNCIALFSLYSVASAADGLIITEIMFNPAGDENAREFVEIVNVTSEPVSLEGYSIGDGSGYDELRIAGEGSWYVSPGQYALIIDPDYFDADEQYENIPDTIPIFTVSDKAIGLRGLSNSAEETVSLISATGDTLSAVRYSLDCPPGRSWERILHDGGDGADNFAPSKAEDGTPGRQNSVLPPPWNPVLDHYSLRFSPQVPVMGERVEIALSFLNSGLETVSGVTVAVLLLPDIPLGSVLFSDDVSYGERSAEKLLVIDSIPGGCLCFIASIVSVDETAEAVEDTVFQTLNVTADGVYLLLNEIMAAPTGKYPEWVELFNAGSFPVDVFGMKIRDFSGAVSDSVDTHCVVEPDSYVIFSGSIPDDVYRDTQVVTVNRFPALNNGGDSVVLLDCMGTVIDSMSYEQTEAGFSLERMSPGTSGGMSDWDICVERSGATPGSQNSIYFAFDSDQDGKHEQSVGLKVSPNPFLDTTSISYNLPFPLARIRILMYDRRGRLVATIRDAEESGSSWSGTWDGRDKGKRLPAGPYILDFEALDKRTGKMYRQRKMVVVASKL